MKILIIGYGNPSRQDDGVGHYVVNRLRRRWGLAPIGLLGEPDGDGPDTCAVGGCEVRLIWLQQLDLALAEDAAAVGRLLLVDCHVDGPEECVWEVEERSFDGPTTHVVTPGALLQVTRRAFGTAPRATVFSVRGERFDFGDALSPEVRVRADALAERIAAWVRADA